MSSIISDIFYNPNNNSLLHRLLKKQSTPHNSQPNQSHSPTQSHVLNSLDSEQPNSPIVSLNITIRLDVGKDSKLKSLQLGVLRVQMGQLVDQDHIDANKSQRQWVARLQFHQIELQHILSHSNLRVQLLKRQNGSNVGVVYLPIENIKDMIQKRMPHKTLTTSMRLSWGEKVKMECDIELLSEDGQIISGFNESQHNSKELGASYQKFDSPSFPRIPPLQQTAPNQATRVRSKPIQRRVSPAQRSSTSNWSDLLKQKDNSSNHLRTGTQDQFHMTTGYGGCRDIGFIAVGCQLSHGRQHIDVSKVKLTLDCDTSENEYSLNQKILIKSSQLRAEGIAIMVKHDSITIGYCHLNIVVLLGGHIAGVFPLLQLEDHTHVGTITFATDIPSKMSQHQILDGAILPQERANISDSCHNDIEEGNYSSYCIDLPKILVMAAGRQKMDGYLEESASIIVRLLGKQQQIVHNHKTNIRLDSLLGGQVLELIVPDPVVIVGGYAQHHTMQFEVYVGYELVGYKSINIKENAIPSVSYSASAINLTSGNFVCHALINIVCLTCHRDFIVPERLPTSLSAIANPILYSKFSQKGATQQQIINSMMSHQDHIIYIQAYRLTQLLMGTRLVRMDALSNTDRIFSEKLLQEVRFLDHRGEGTVAVGDIVQVGGFYHIDEKSCLQWKQDETGRVLYLFLLCGLEAVTSSVILEQNKKSLETKRLESEKQHKQPAELMKDDPQEIQPSPQIIQQQTQLQLEPKQRPKATTNYYSQLICHNLHLLMPSHSIPSLRVKIPSQEYTSRTAYSAIDPTIKLHRRLENGQQMLLYHHSIKERQDILLAAITVSVGCSQYRLGKGATARLIQ